MPAVRQKLHLSPCADIDRELTEIELDAVSGGDLSIRVTGTIFPL